MSTGRLDALTDLLALTQASWAQCERGESSADDLLALARTRADLLAGLEPHSTSSAAERDLVARIHALDEQILTWCRVTRTRIDRALAGALSRSPTPCDSTGLLSEIA